MKVKKLIKLLENYNPDAEVKMHHKDGLNVSIFAKPEFTEDQMRQIRIGL